MEYPILDMDDKKPTKRGKEMETEFEVPAKFAKRVGLPERLIRNMVRQGQIPHIPTGKRGVRISIRDGIEALRQFAGLHVADIAARMPVPIQIQPPLKKKACGRKPDSIRLLKKVE